MEKVYPLIDNCYQKIEEFLDYEKATGWNLSDELAKRFSKKLCFVKFDVGFYVGYEKDDETYHLWLFAVFPEYRGKGYAKELINHFTNFAKERKYKYASVKTHYPLMIKAVKSCGYQTMTEDNVFQLRLNTF